MEYRLLGGWGLKVPFLSLGTGTFGGTPGLFDAFDIIGARNEEQLRQNLGAIGWNLTKEQIAKLDAASAVTKAYPYFHQDNFAERNPFPV